MNEYQEGSLFKILDESGISGKDDNGNDQIFEICEIDSKGYISYCLFNSPSLKNYPFIHKSDFNKDVLCGFVQFIIIGKTNDSCPKRNISKCVCEDKVLFNKGCQCGAFKNGDR
jgi:hypothetical protein